MNIYVKLLKKDIMMLVSLNGKHPLLFYHCLQISQGERLVLTSVLCYIINYVLLYYYFYYFFCYFLLFFIILLYYYFY